MKRKVCLLLGVLLLGVPVLAGKTPPAQKPRAQAAFQHSYAYGSCAPWDGAAIQIVLRTQPFTVSKGKLPEMTYPSYTLSLWTDKPKMNQWKELPEYGISEAGGGHIGYCVAYGKCENRAGRVKITQFIPDKLIGGELRVPLKDKTGREFVFPFTAPLIVHQAFCG